MSKSAALLLAFAIGAGACTQPEPEQTIFAVVESDEQSTKSTSEAPDTPDSTDAPSDNDISVPEESPVTTEAPQSSTTETAEAPTTTTPAQSEGHGAQQLLAASLSPAAEFSSVRFDGAMVMTGSIEGDSFDMEMIMRGGHDENAQTTEFYLDMSSMTSLFGLSGASAEEAAFAEAIFAEPMQMITVGDKGWMKWGMLTMFTGETDKWVEMEIEEAAEMNFSGTNPTEMLEALEGADGPVEKLGTEKIRGVNTTHYVLNLEMDDYLGEMTRREAAEVTEIVGNLDELPLHLWLDSDGLLRRMEMQISSAEFASFTEDEFDLWVWFEMFDYGADLNITPPPASDVISADELSLTS